MTISSLADFGVKYYDSPLEEAARCRGDSALFDFSFMHKLRISGDFDITVLENALSRNLSTLQAGDIRYCLYSDANGSVTADLTVWCINHRCFEVYAGRSQEIELIAALVPGESVVEDLSDSTSIFSIQGPRSLEQLSQLGDVTKLLGLSYFQHVAIELAGIECRLGRLGYTGEKGFEIIIDEKSTALELWRQLSDICKPAGTAAIDILRIEAGFILFLNECRFDCNATELGLSRFANTQSRDCRFELVCFQAGACELDLPWSPPAQLPEPGDGEISITSASISMLCDGVLGLGFVRYPLPFNKTFRDVMSGFDDIRIVNRPFYDSRKKIPRSAWLEFF